jgi:site-specific recombinase XerD
MNSDQPASPTAPPTDSPSPASQPNPPKLLDQVRTAIRLRRMSYSTEQTYTDWIKRFILFHNKRHPREMGAPEIRDFLAYLVNERNVAASTQNQALHSILFLYREVLQIELPYVGLGPVKKEKCLPVVLTRAEVQAVLSRLTGTKWLMASLLYGAGLRLRECLRLRVKDIDFDRNLIVVREGKGDKDRVTLLGHADVSTTMIYTHVLNRGGLGVRSPLDVN